MEIFKTSIWLHNLCVKLQTGDLLFEKWLLKSSRYHDPVCWTSNELKVMSDNKIKCYLVDIFWELWYLIPWDNKVPVPSQLAQRRCDNVVTTSWLTLWQRCGKGENESCSDVSFQHCDSVVVRRCHNLATTSLLHQRMVAWVLFNYG